MTKTHMAIFLTDFCGGQDQISAFQEASLQKQRETDEKFHANDQAHKKELEVRPHQACIHISFMHTYY